MRTDAVTSFLRRYRRLRNHYFDNKNRTPEPAVIVSASENVFTPIPT